VKKYLSLSTALLLGFSSLAFAHPGHGLESAYAGFMHPLTGWDHLLVMVAVGIWAVKTDEKACWKLPLAFSLSMILGFILSFTGYRFSGVETSVAASVMAMGLLLMVNLPINASIRLGLVSLFAIFHGMAHGVELNMQSGLNVMTGMLIATALLHGVGILIGTLHTKVFQYIQNVLALCMILLGGYALL